MIDKEVGEIRRRFRPDKSNITRIIGCYVNQQREIVSQFSQSVAMMPEDEGEKFLNLFKRTLSGSVGKQLTDISFSTEQVASGSQHKLLSRVRTSALEDGEALTELYEKIIETVTFEDNFAILLAYDSYDVPYYGKDGFRNNDQSDTVFTYIVCSICPVKMAKPGLSYQMEEQEFHNRTLDWILSPPELGFMFPSFDDRATNLYNVLYYNRNLNETNEAFVDALFGAEPWMAVNLQKEAFEEVLQDALGEECQFEVLQSVHQQFRDLVEEHKANKEPTPLALSKGEVSYILENAGVSETAMEDFDGKYQECFGENQDLMVKNVVDTSKFSVDMGEISIRFKPEYQDLVQTKYIDGVPYIMIRVEDGVSVNGVPVHVSEKN